MLRGAAFSELEQQRARQRVEAALAPFVADQQAIEHANREIARFKRENPTCGCCGPWGSAGKALIEDEFGSLWCPLCAYTILRTGICSAHGNTIHYPEIAKTQEPLPVSSIPMELFGATK